MSDNETTATRGDILLRAHIFASARAAAGVRCNGPETGFREGWFPRLASQWVCNTDDPKLGYETRAAAVVAAQKFKASCVEFINHG